MLYIIQRNIRLRLKLIELNQLLAKPNHIVFLNGLQSCSEHRTPCLCRCRCRSRCSRHSWRRRRRNHFVLIICTLFFFFSFRIYFLPSLFVPCWLSLSLPHSLSLFLSLSLSPSHTASIFRLSRCVHTKPNQTQLNTNAHPTTYTRTYSTHTHTHLFGHRCPTAMHHNWLLISWFHDFLLLVSFVLRLHAWNTTPTSPQPRQQSPPNRKICYEILYMCVLCVCCV